MAAARDIQGDDYATVAVIGDGSLTGGLALEGLNNLGASRSDSIVILNDNGMSIDQSTGGMHSLLWARSSVILWRCRNRVWTI